MGMELRPAPKPLRNQVVHLGRIVTDAHARPQHRGSLACDIPGEARPGAKSFVKGLIKRAAVLLHHARGRERIEVAGAVMVHQNRRLQFVAQPQVHGHSRIQPEIILKIKRFAVEAEDCISCCGFTRIWLPLPMFPARKSCRSVEPEQVCLIRRWHDATTVKY